MFKKICQHCGKEYTTAFRTQKYCSTECYAKAAKRPIIKQCLGCGKEFEAKSHYAKYCSIRCYHKHMSPYRR